MSKSPLWTSQFIALSAINFLSFFGFQMIMPSLPLYLGNQDIASHHVGLILASFSLAVLFTRPLAGVWLDQGRDRICVLIGILVCVLATGGYWLAPSVFFLVAARMMHGGGFGVVSVSYGTIVTRLIPVDRRGEGMGYFGLSLSLAQCLGPWAGTWMMAETDFATVLIVSALCVLSALFWINKLPPRPQRISIPRNRLSRDSFYEKTVWFPCFLCIFLGTSFGAIVAFVTLWGKELGMFNVGAFFLINASFSFLVRLVSGKVSDSFGYGYVIVPGAIMQIIGVVLLGNATDITGFLWAGAFLGLGGGAVLPALQAWVADLSPVERRGAAMACFYNAYDIGIGGGIMLWGVVIDWVGYSKMYFISVTGMVLLLLFYSLYGFKKLARSRRLKRLRQLRTTKQKENG